MNPLTIIVIPLFGLAGMVLLFGILSPVPILRPALTGLARGAIGMLRSAFPTRRMPGWLGAARTDARIAALERRNRSLEMRVAELTDCVLRSLAISLETQQTLETAARDRDRPSRAA